MEIEENNPFELQQSNNNGTLKQKILELRKNIINWYPFRRNSNLLEINSFFGEITEELKRVVEHVETINSIEESSNTIGQKFDYIILIGLEKYQITLKDFLSFAKEHLKEDGTILLACNNKYGLKTYTVNCDNTEDVPNTLSKNEIEKVLRSENINNYNFYYPLPDYEKTSVIFSDRYLPNEESIQRDFCLHEDSEILIFNDERAKYKEIIKEDKKLFPFFANAYFIEISNKQNDVKFISFNNYRKDEYKTKTIIKEKIACKSSVSIESNHHLQDMKRNIDLLNQLNIKLVDKYIDGTVQSTIVDQENELSQILINKIKDNNKQEAYELIDRFIAEIKGKLLNNKEESKENTVFKKYGIKIFDEINEKFNYIKYGFFDLIFQNCFLINNEFYFYDQEWIEENIPFEFIIYRAIEYLGSACNSVDKAEIFKRYNISEYINCFGELEKKLLLKIRDEKIWEMHMLNNTTVKNLYDTNRHNINLKTLANNTITEQKVQIENLQNELKMIKNSKSWKLTKPLRVLKRKLK